MAKKGYELTYEWVVKLLPDLDFAEAAARLGLEQTGKDEVAVRFAGMSYKIRKNGITRQGEAPSWKIDSPEFDFNLKSVLGYYLLSEGKSEPGNDFCPLQHFSHGVFRDDAGWTRGDEIAEAHGNDREKFKRTAEKLGLVLESEKSGESIWRYQILPKIPLKIIYCEGDDEYPSKVRILFDKTAIEYYKFEPLAVLLMCVRKVLSAAAGA